MSVEKENSVSKSKGLMDWAEDLYPLLDMFLGLDDKLQAYLEENPEVAKAVYYQTRGIGGDFASEEASIDEAKLKEEMAFGNKAFLLLNDWVGDRFNGENFANLVDLWPVEEAKKHYRALSQLRPSYKTTEVEGFPHMILPETTQHMDILDYHRLLKNKDSSGYTLREKLENGTHGNFPLPLGGRVVLRQKLAPVVMAVLQQEAEATGKKVSLLLPGELRNPPSEDECQIILAPAADVIEFALDWELVSKYLPIWEDKEVPAVGWSPELVAAIYVLKGQTPQEACKTAGLSSPTEAFLKKLAEYTPDEDPDRAL